MIKVIITARRPANNIPFYTRPMIINGILEIQQTEGKFLRESRNISEDGLIFTYEGIWNSIEDYNEFRANDQVVEYGNQRTAYNIENGISIVTTVLDYMNS
jgi:hypothetical protein